MIDTDDRLVPGPEASEITGVSRSRRYELQKHRKFPQPVKVGKRTLYSSGELQAWVRDRLAERVAR